MYKNPRLKIVKEIKDLCLEIKENTGDQFVQRTLNAVLDQCNFLLEKKKKKKCGAPMRYVEPDRCVHGIKYEDKCLECYPSPQPEKKSAGALVTDCCGTEDFDPWGFDRGDGTYDERCGKCGKKTDVNWKEYPKVEPSPQPNDDGYYGASGAGTPHTSSPQPECNHEWKYADIPNGEDGEYCVKCHKKLDYEDIKPSSQPEKIEADENEDWFTSKQYAKNYREREELLRREHNKLVDQLNKIIKTK